MTKEKETFGGYQGISARNFIPEKFHLHFCYIWN